MKIKKVKYLGESSTDLIKGEVYVCLGIEENEFYRVIDESQEDYLYPINEFEIVEEQQIYIVKNLGAKAKNYNIMDLETGETYHFTEWTYLQNVTVFAGKGAKEEFRKASKYAERDGGKPSDWQYTKGIGWIDTNEDSV